MKRLKKHGFGYFKPNVCSVYRILFISKPTERLQYESVARQKSHTVRGALGCDVDNEHMNILLGLINDVPAGHPA